MRFAFLTSTPQNISAGSGTYVGIATLAGALRRRGIAIDVFGPSVWLPMYTLSRRWFNEQLRARDFAGYDVVVGFDMDGFRLRMPHIASLKGVIADEAQYETGLTRRLLELQAGWERRNVHGAQRVLTTSLYAARRIQQLYGLPETPRVVPELIDLTGWRQLFDSVEGAPDPARFVVLSVARFYRRKRIDLLLDAARLLEGRIPGFELRIVGGGPEGRRLRGLAPRSAKFLGTVSRRDLALEYKRCDVFCLPSVQEGFGIVFLEAMAAGRAIVAASASAAPEVVPHALLAAPDDAGALAQALHIAWSDPTVRDTIARAGSQHVQRYDAPVVAAQFLEALEGLRF
ncbi:MAG: glycosyltransferase family 4 protein [Bryobacteraceae bacterium]